MTSLLKYPEVQSLRQKMFHLEYVRLVQFLLSELKRGPKHDEANYLTFLSEVIDLLEHNQVKPMDIVKARQLALSIHRYSREVVEEPLRYLYRMLGHAVATIHVKTHAFGYVYYWLKYNQVVNENQHRLVIEYFNEQLR